MTKAEIQEFEELKLKIEQFKEEEKELAKKKKKLFKEIDALEKKYSRKKKNGTDSKK